MILFSNNHRSVHFRSIAFSIILSQDKKKNEKKQTQQLKNVGFWRWAEA